MKNIIFAILLSTILAVSACKSTVNENKPLANNANIKQPVNNPLNNFNANKTVEIKETPKPKQTSDLPKFEKEEDYKKSVREKLLKAGWIPARSEDGESNCLGQKSLCEELPELVAGPSSPLGQAIMRWKKDDKILLVSTIDTFLFNGYEYEKTNKTEPTVNIEGKYIYSSKHEYGVDRYIFDLQSENIATYETEVEGGDGQNWKGTWEWNKKDQTVVVYSDASDNEESKTYIFKFVGKNLRMIKEPQMPKGVIGFSGRIYKRQ